MLLNFVTFMFVNETQMIVSEENQNQEVGKIKSIYLVLYTYRQFTRKIIFHNIPRGSPSLIENKNKCLFIKLYLNLLKFLKNIYNTLLYVILID